MTNNLNILKICLPKKDNSFIRHWITSQRRYYAKEAVKQQANQKYQSVIGLEIHAQITSKSKLFSGAESTFAAAANNCVSAFDASIPGTLPSLNRACVEAAIKTALALNCRINPISMFDRKHYFYADLPAGYQITQQRAALANDGQITFNVVRQQGSGKKKGVYQKTVHLHQLQLEQDSGKSLHDVQAKKSLVDLNRAGIPLMELVFDPQLSNGDEAAAMLKELVLILTTLKTCSCKMEEGALRIDANISINKPGEPLGVRTEVKNIGSIRGVADAIDYEIQRQIHAVESGGRIYNETRSWDAGESKTIAMRDKEVLQDYRFMPEPNLPPLHIKYGSNGLDLPHLIDADLIEAKLPELPEAIRQKLVRDFGLTYDLAVILMNEQNLLAYFNDILKTGSPVPAKTIANFLVNDLLKLCHQNNLNTEEITITSKQLIQLFEMLHNETINLNLARLIVNEILQNSPDKLPQQIADEHNWIQIKDVVEITNLCIDALEKNPKLIEQYRRGKERVLFALAGEIFKKTGQRVNMELVVEKLKELLLNQKT